MNAVEGFINSVGFLPGLGLILLVGLYIFWRDAKITNKNRNSIFDLWSVSILFAFLWGRLSYIAANWSVFSKIPWFYSPYEKYEDGVFVLRLLPWRFFKIWDGGFLFTGVFMGFLLAGFLYVVFIKKWRWKEMMPGIVLSSQIMMSMLLFVYGVVIDFASLKTNSLYLMLLSLSFYVLDSFFIWLIKEGYSKIRVYFVSLFNLISFLFVSKILFQGNISKFDRANIYITGLLVLIFITYVVFDSLRGDVHRESKEDSVRKVPKSFMQAIKPKVLARKEAK